MKVALDIDDVLADFYGGICKTCDRPEVKTDIWDGVDKCKWIIKSMDLVNTNKFFWKHLSRISNPNSINFDVKCYITSSPINMVMTRYKWLIDNGFPDVPVYYSKDKLKLMIALDIDILVDDRPSTIEKVNKGGKIGLQFKPGYMTEEIDDKSKIITHLSEVGDYIKKMK